VEEERMNDNRTTLGLGALKTDARNARRHTPRNVAMIEQALQEVGAARSIVIDEDGTVLAGNATIEAAVHAGIDRVHVVDGDGETLIAVRRTGLTPEQKARLALYDNRAAELAAWDTAMLQQLLEAMPDLSKGLWGAQELRELFAEADRSAGSGVDAEPQIDKAEELQREWQTARGQLWTLGAHRLLVGDVRTDCPALFEGDRFRLLVTDPPYGVSYADKNRFLNAAGKGNRIQKPIASDHQTPEAMSQFWRGCFTAARAYAEPGAAYYVTGPQGGDLLLLLLLALRESGFPLRHMLIWAKNNHVLGRCDYHYKHEPILYGWVEGSHRWFGGASQFSVWAIDKPQQSTLHPTTKPVELYARAMANSSEPGDIVADLFCGSGTAIISAHNLNRRCYAMEIDPGYAAVTLQRYVDATGTRPVLVGAMDRRKRSAAPTVDRAVTTPTRTHPGGVPKQRLSERPPLVGGT
jgi:DNA modification methylase